jgi:hypothetical protein
VGGASGENANHNNRLCVNLCFQRFYLSPPPRTTLNVSSSQSRFPFCFSFLLFQNSHRLVLVCGVAGAGGAGAGGGDNEGKDSHLYSIACDACLGV